MQDKALDKIIQHYSAAQAIERLSPYLTDTRKQRIATLLPTRISSVHVAVESPADPHNAAAIVRTAEALGAMSIHVVKAEDKSLHAKGTTQGAYNWVNTYHHASLNEFLTTTKQQQLLLAGAVLPTENSNTTRSNHTLDQIPIEKPLCLFFGNEKRGLSEAAKQACDMLFHIPMFGVSESLNLSVSAAISLYETLKRKRANIKKDGDLGEEQQETLCLKYYIYSLEDRLVRQVLKV